MSESECLIVNKASSSGFWAAGKEGLRVFAPVSVGLIPWAIVTGMAMAAAGLSLWQALGMNMLVYAGTAQLATLPMIKVGAPIWLIVLTALVLNLRFIIFSAAIAKGFSGISTSMRWFLGYLLTDGIFAVSVEKILATEDRSWRLGYYLVPSLCAWFLWQLFGWVGMVAAKYIPQSWSLEFMATIALMMLLIPMAKLRPSLIAAVVAMAASLALKNMPLRLGVFFAILLGIAAGYLAESWYARQRHKGA